MLEWKHVLRGYIPADLCQHAGIKCVVGDGGRAGRVRDTRRLSAGTLGAVVAQPASQSTPRPAGGFEALVSFLFSFLPSSPKSVYNFFNRFIYARTVDC